MANKEKNYCSVYDGSKIIELKLKNLCFTLEVSVILRHVRNYNMLAEEFMGSVSLEISENVVCQEGEGVLPWIDTPLTFQV